jgi:hypothetical protein
MEKKQSQKIILEEKLSFGKILLKEEKSKCIVNLESILIFYIKEWVRVDLAIAVH